MENIFNFIASGFASCNTVGFLKIGLVLAVVCALVFAMLQAWLCLWAFIDDKKVKDLLPFCLRLYADPEDPVWSSAYEDKRWHKEGEYILKMTGKSANFYIKPEALYYENATGFALLAGCLGSIFGMAALGIIIDIVTWAPIISSVVITIIAAVLLARGVRRLQKKLKAHMEDLEAHKEKK